MKNRSEFEIAKYLMDEEYYLDAIKILKKIHKEEPYNNVIKFELARAWIISGISPERGEKFLNKIIDNNNSMSSLAKLELGKLEMCRNNRKVAKRFFEGLLNSSRNRDYALAELIFLEIHEENFEKAYEYYIEKEPCGWDFQNSRQIETYLKMNVGLIKDLDKIKKYYFCSQVINYSKERALEHIELHLDENEKKQYHSVYNDNINVRDLYEESKIRISSINPSCVTIVDKYILEYGKPIGKSSGEETDCLRVVTLPNTTNILSMYPMCNPKTRIKK